MTRYEFVTEVDDWSKLLDFCWGNSCDICDEIICASDLDGYIADDFREYSHSYEWTDIRGWLNDIETGCEYYVRFGSFEYVSADDDFDEYYEEVLDWADRNDVFDYEEDEDDEEEEFEEETPFVVETDFSIGELMSACNNRFKTAEEDRLREEAERESKVTEFFCSC